MIFHAKVGKGGINLQVLWKLYFAMHIVSLCLVCGLRLIEILFCSVLFCNVGTAAGLGHNINAIFSYDTNELNKHCNNINKYKYITQLTITII